MKWDDFNCGNSDYLSILQCSHSTSIDSGCVNSNSYDATVYCYTARIWDSNPFSGMIRLQDGDYSNEGRVEVYCNGQWGTICSDGVDSYDATTLCKQLGFKNYSIFFALPSNSSQPIWSDSDTSSFSVVTNTKVTCSHVLDGVPQAVNGAIVLSRNNISSTTYYYGTIRVYYNGWGNICYRYYFDVAEANVICHQLGYTGASSYSRAGSVRLSFYEIG
uniref:SRCR domain-containing protein n=1 Tax=Amphimedon queenslandica TaxID=400682 RepID=A0A1X7T1D1_AMPQE